MKKIAIIGASYLQNPLILRAKEMGLETHVFAWKAGDIGETTADHFYPISITSDARYNNYSPRLLEGEEAERVLEKMKQSTGQTPGDWSEEEGAVSVWPAP